VWAGQLQGGYDRFVRFFPGAWGEYEWQCVELVMRYMYLVYGIAPYSADGNSVVSNYNGNALTKVRNNGNGVPSSGDIVSMAGTASNPNGHTGVVTAVNVTGGKGTVTIMEQNASSTGWGPINVSGNVLGSLVTGWLHHKVSAPGPKLASVSSLRTPDGYIHVFSGNSTGSVWETWFGNGHAPTSDLLGTPTGSPITSVSSMYAPDDYIHVFAGVQSGDIYEFYFGNGNPPKLDKLSNLDGQPVTSVSSVQTSDGYIHVRFGSENVSGPGPGLMPAAMEALVRQVAASVKSPQP
jgi:hypothetical protein